MAKNLNSVSFMITVLLLVLVMASTEFLKSEAQCGCINPTFLDECGAVPFVGSNADCCNCCKLKFKSLACDGHVEGTEKHCHCKKKA